ncbi:Lrp/AsnC family transcriptional regulator [Terrilactibacillus laevilacticus]|uniref:Lrp/AsnC family transcriptional regulator n=1 Tax=Terrilactibacillus laevilacticus TaxID=1380157 RepID=A0ABW5PQV3_9BACI|nr:Lrp/AsnC family transcriptional regulator [Terrilactibacillus laevilacticus]
MNPAAFELPESKLDEIDKKILTIFHEDGRISFTDLGKRVGLSRVAVATRVTNLMEKGIIEKFTAVINPSQIGMDVSAFYNVEVEPQHLQSVAEQLSLDPAVTSLYHMTGPSKLHMHGIFSSNKEMENFLVEKLYPMEGVISVDCQVLIKRYKSRMGMKL